MIFMIALVITLMDKQFLDDCANDFIGNTIGGNVHQSVEMVSRRVSNMSCL